MMKPLVSAIVMMLAWPALFAQNTMYIRLPQKKVAYMPVSFYIKDVIDDRADKSSIGSFSDQGKQQPAALENGVTSAIRIILPDNSRPGKTQEPIAVHITKLNFDIKKDASGIKTDAFGTFSFYAGNIKLIEFTGKGHGETDTDPGDYMAGFIQQALENDLKKFDGWWQQNKGNVATSADVKVNVSIGKVSDVPNSIVYSVQRPLQFSDFQGTPAGHEGPEMAATLSGMGFGYNTETENGHLVLNVTVTPYFDKSGSWFKEAGKNALLLAHEQAHFDITAIKACELVATIRNTVFTQENYEQLLDQLRDKNEKETDSEETMYDDETKHGTVPVKQGEWEQKVKARVREVGCY